MVSIRSSASRGAVQHRIRLRFFTRSIATDRTHGWRRKARTGRADPDSEIVKAENETSAIPGAQERLTRKRASPKSYTPRAIRLARIWLARVAERGRPPALSTARRHRQVTRVTRAPEVTSSPTRALCGANTRNCLRAACSRTPRRHARVEIRAVNATRERDQLVTSGIAALPPGAGRADRERGAQRAVHLRADLLQPGVLTNTNRCDVHAKADAGAAAESRSARRERKGTMILRWTSSPATRSCSRSNRRSSS